MRNRQGIGMTPGQRIVRGITVAALFALMAFLYIGLQGSELVS